MNDVVLNKIASIQRCIQRAREEFAADPDGFDTDFTRQDAATLNVLRACEQAIDLANHVIKTRQLGVPTSSADSFDLLRQAGILDDELTRQLQKMVRFRNIVIHNYERLALAVLRSVITDNLDDLLAFGQQILTFLDSMTGEDRRTSPQER